MSAQAVTEAAVGISLRYRRVTPDVLRDLRALYREEVVNELLFPSWSLALERVSPEAAAQILDLDKRYPLVEGFLNPDSQSETIFFRAMNCGRPVTGEPWLAGGEYLGVGYYLTADEVRALGDALRELDEEPASMWADRYRRLMRDASVEEALARSDFPTYTDVVDLVGDFHQFFLQAAEAGEAVLWCYC